MICKCTKLSVEKIDTLARAIRIGWMHLPRVVPVVIAVAVSVNLESDLIKRDWKDAERLQPQ